MPLDPSKVRARREALKLTQGEAAEQVGLTRPNYVRIEAGRAKPQLETAERLATALKVPLSKLLAAGPSSAVDRPRTR